MLSSNLNQHSVLNSGSISIVSKETTAEKPLWSILVYLAPENSSQLRRWQGRTYPT